MKQTKESYEEIKILKITFYKFVKTLNVYLKANGYKMLDEEWKTLKNGEHIKVDNEGNVKAGAGGALSYPDYFTEADKKEADSKIKELDKIDFEGLLNKDSNAYLELPRLSRCVLDGYGLKDLPIRLAKWCLVRNKGEHSDVFNSRIKSIIGNSLYKPVSITEYHSNSSKLAFYGSARTGKYSTVALEMQEQDGYYKILHFYYIDEKKFNKHTKRDNEIKRG